nr:unnamed protein product [Callosobruchus analis]
MCGRQFRYKYNLAVIERPPIQLKNRLGDIKVAMPNWSFCRALILSTPSIVNKIKGSAPQAELFSKGVDPVKNLFLTTSQEYPQGKTRFDRKRVELIYWKKRWTLFERICEKIECLKNPATDETLNTFVLLRSDGDGWLSKSDKENLTASDDSSERSFTPNASSSFQVLDFLIHSEANSVRDYGNISFVPDIKEDKPVIGAPTETVKTLGIKCKKLGSTSWKRVR